MAHCRTALVWGIRLPCSCCVKNLLCPACLTSPNVRISQDSLNLWPEEMLKKEPSEYTNLWTSHLEHGAWPLYNLFLACNSPGRSLEETHGLHSPPASLLTIHGDGDTSLFLLLLSHPFPLSQGMQHGVFNHSHRGFHLSRRWAMVLAPPTGYVVKHDCYTY